MLTHKDIPDYKMHVKMTGEKKENSQFGLWPQGDPQRMQANHNLS